MTKICQICDNIQQMALQIKCSPEEYLKFVKELQVSDTMSPQKTRRCRRNVEILRDAGKVSEPE